MSPIRYSLPIDEGYWETALEDRTSVVQVCGDVKNPATECVAYPTSPRQSLTVDFDIATRFKPSGTLVFLWCCRSALPDLHIAESWLCTLRPSNQVFYIQQAAMAREENETERSLQGRGDQIGGCREDLTSSPTRTAFTGTSRTTWLSLTAN